MAKTAVIAVCGQGRVSTLKDSTRGITVALNTVQKGLKRAETSAVRLAGAQRWNPGAARSGGQGPIVYSRMVGLGFRFGDFPGAASKTLLMSAPLLLILYEVVLAAVGGGPARAVGLALRLGGTDLRLAGVGSGPYADT